MFYRAAAAGFAGLTLFYVNAQAQGTDIQKHLIDLDRAAQSCPDLLKSAQKTYVFDEVVLPRSHVEASRHVIRQAELPIGPISLPIPVVGYVMIDDPTRLLELQADRKKHLPEATADLGRIIEATRKGAEQSYLFRAVTSVLENYKTILEERSQKALDDLIEAQGEVSAWESLKVQYRSEAERSVFEQIMADQEKSLDGLLLSEYFKQIGADLYNKIFIDLLKSNNSDQMVHIAYDRLVAAELEKMDVFEIYKTKFVEEDQVSEDEIKTGFSQAFELAKSGKGSLEENLRANKTIANLLDLMPKDSLIGPSGVLDYSEIEASVQKSKTYFVVEPDNPLKYTHGPILLLFPRNQYMDGVLSSYLDDKQSDVSLSIIGTLGCVWESDMIEKTQNLRGEANKILALKDGKLRIDLGMTADSVAILEKQRPYAVPSGRVLYFLASEFKVKQKNTQVLSSPAKTNE